VAGVLAGYTADVIWLPPGGETLHGKAAIRARYESLFSRFSVSLSSEVVEARAEGGLGFVRGLTNGALTPIDGGAPTVVDDKFVALVRCEEGVWRVSHLMWSPRGQVP
jgi:ketosteroid isomerase-like protein